MISFVRYNGAPASMGGAGALRTRNAKGLRRVEETLAGFFFFPSSCSFSPLLFFGCCVRSAMELTLTNSTLLQVAAITAKNSVDLLPSGSKKKVRACLLATVRMQCGVGRVWAVWAGCGWLVGWLAVAF